jgi:hypothetical protein
MRPGVARDGNKRFVIGIGSQRAGTTLLHEVIESCTSVYMHPLKELHYFDTLHGIRSPDAVQEFSRRQLQREIEKICAADEFGFINKRFKNYLRSNFLLYSRPIEEIDYLDLFRPCLHGNGSIGEITPEYMGLPEAGVEHMARVVGRDACIILVARNPVARVMSSFKLLNVYNNIKLSPAEAEEKLFNLIASESTWIHAQDRLNDYEIATQRFAAHFDRLLLLRYDDFIENPEHLRVQLEEYLGEPVAEAPFREVLVERKNSLGVGQAFSPEVLSRLEQRYAGAAQYLERQFGMPCTL